MDEELKQYLESIKNDLNESIKSLLQKQDTPPSETPPDIVEIPTPPPVADTDPEPTQQTSFIKKLENFLF